MRLTVYSVLSGLLYDDSCDRCDHLPPLSIFCVISRSVVIVNHLARNRRSHKLWKKALMTLHHMARYINYNFILIIIMGLGYLYLSQRLPIVKWIKTVLICDTEQNPVLWWAALTQRGLFWAIRGGLVSRYLYRFSTLEDAGLVFMTFFVFCLDLICFANETWDKGDCGNQKDDAIFNLDFDSQFIWRFRMVVNGSGSL